MNKTTIVKFSNNTVAFGNKENQKFIDFILDICNNQKCEITSMELTDNKIEFK